jgi:alpha-beta hydrolase superfamily lysophospholipase
MGSFLARQRLIAVPDFYRKAVISGTTTVAAMTTKVAILLCGLIIAFKGPRYVSPMIQKMAIDACPALLRKDGIIKERDVEWLTKDVEIQNYYFNSPMCGQPFTVSANRDVFRWMGFVDAVRNIDKGNKATPLLFICGGNDPLSHYGKDVRALVDVFHSRGYGDVALHVYEGDRHEVLNELDKDKVWADVLAFLEK